MAEQSATGATPADQQGGQGTPASEKTFTQAELNAAVATDRRKDKAQLEALTSKQAEQQSAYEKLQADITAKDERLTGLETYLKALAGDPDEEAEPSLLDEPEPEKLPSWAKTADGRRLARLMRQVETALRAGQKDAGEKLTVLEVKIAAAEKREQEAEAKRQAAQARAVAKGEEALLAQICNEVDGVDPVVVQRYFKGLLKYDEASDSYQYKNAEGTWVDAKTGIAAEFPDVLRKPTTRNGGSGSGGSRTAPPEAELTAARAQLTTLKERAENSNSDHGAIQAYMTAKRTVERLEREQGSSQRKAA